MPDERQTAQQQALARRADELRIKIRGRDPEKLAASSGAVFENGIYRLDLFGKPLRFSFPECQALDAASGAVLPTFLQALLLYYFVTADGTPPARKWVSFADLPGGRMYAQAFQGYSGNEVVKVFGLDVNAFRQACESCGGARLEMGEAAYQFQALPLLPLAITYWPGDDDFPSTSKILFDASACHYLPIDACAILGGMLTRKVLQS
jgi:hypothetical protein